MQKGRVGASIVNAIRDRWDHRAKRPLRQHLHLFLNIPVSNGDLRVVWIPVDRAKVAVHWLTCATLNKFPDFTQPLWKRFQCSERCTNKVFQE